MVPLTTPIITKFISSVFTKLGVRGILVIALMSAVGVQSLIINKNRETIVELKVKNKKLTDDANTAANESKDLQDRIDKAQKENKTLTITIEKLKKDLMNKPIPTNCSGMINETREVNDRAIQLWKK